MNIQIRYLSRTGNTKKIALAISEAAGVEAKTVKDPVQAADILFLGGAIYASKADKRLMEFAGGLDDRIKKVAIFSTSAGDASVYDEISQRLREKNISVCEDNFHCKGRFLFWLRGVPNRHDLDEAKKFAARIIEGAK